MKINNKKEKSKKNQHTYKMQEVETTNDLWKVLYTQVFYTQWL